MTLAELIMKLVDLEQEHGGDIQVMLDHAELLEVLHVEADNGCPAYVSLESE